MIKALYLHIPFCDHICAYCDFPKVLKSYFDTSLYIDKLIEEIESLNIPFDSLKTIYIGGGTPSALDEKDLITLLSYLEHHFPSVKEYSIECNPESLSSSKLQILKRYGINRISLGVQSSDDQILKKLGRCHTSSSVTKAINLIREAGFNNLNLDFIYGLENTTLKDLEKDIDFALSFKPEHLSFYSLQVEEGTLFKIRRTETLNEDLLSEEYKFICQQLRNHGYTHYEISNFALPSFECEHNLTYWRDEEYYAAGLGASSYVGNLRTQNTLSLTEYLKGENKKKSEEITKSDEEFEFLMLSLRLKEGISLSEYQRRFNKDFLSTYKKGLEKEKDFLLITDRSVAVKEEYFYILDSIFLGLCD